MRRFIPAALSCTLAMVLGTGCSSSGKEIALVGEKSEITELVGVWQGTFKSSDGTRDGLIELHVAGNSRTATGSVVMSMPDSADTSVRLAINFFQIAGGWVSGRLDPYEHPACSCKVESLFQGRLAGDSMVGTYTIRGVSQEFLRTGDWVMTRAAADDS